MVLQMANKKYDKIFKQKIARLHLEEGRTLTRLSREYNIAKFTLNGWIKSFSEECIESKDKISPNVYEEIKLLKKRATELGKENAFLKRRQPSSPKR